MHNIRRKSKRKKKHIIWNIYSDHDLFRDSKVVSKEKVFINFKITWCCRILFYLGLTKQCNGYKAKKQTREIWTATWYLCLELTTVLLLLCSFVGPELKYTNKVMILILGGRNQKSVHLHSFPFSWHIKIIVISYRKLDDILQHTA
jgi:hypothetical protein